MRRILPGVDNVPVEAPVPGDRRRRVARGSIVNSVFLVGLGLLNTMKGVLAAVYLTPAEFGIWSILFLAVALLIGLKAAGVSDKYIQQDAEDQELAFQRGFTLELISSVLLVGMALILAPLFALLYGESRLILPMVVLALMLVGLALQAPIWVFYRRMDFLRQRIYLSVDPVVSFVLTVALAVAGFGYWSLVIGSVAGALTGGVVALAVSPYPLALRFDRDTTKEYVSFSWPLLVAVGSALTIAHVSIFIGNLAVGLSASGAIGLAAIFSAYADRVNSIVTQTMYPAICRAADSRETLEEAFEKSNRLAMMWGIPFGVGLSLFAVDLVSRVLGAEWNVAVILLQAFGLTAAVGQIAFNYGAFYRAIGQTRPIAVITVAALLTFLAVATPLTFTSGLDGLAVGTVAMALVALAFRVHYIRALFPGFRILRHILRAVTPTLPAAAVVLLIRLLAEDGERSGGLIVGEFALFSAIVVVTTLIVERHLLREMWSYLRITPAVEAA